MAGTQPSNAAISGAAWVQPQPQAVLGLSSSAIFGSAFTSSIPQSFQLATGSLFKLVVDPDGVCFSLFGAGAATIWHRLRVLLGSGSPGKRADHAGHLANVSWGWRTTSILARKR